uniref:Uncharacterized protein n=1 Tax=Ananas comosus var. bracteatus TaxID=296719 RepID=A0A6V7NGX7_ANACO|nr:unnamed protein product [Ananas comosus var. bracteatus]
MLLVLSNCKDGSFDAASKLIQHQTEEDQIILTFVWFKWGRSPLDDELRSSHLYWTRRLRLPQLTVPSGADLVGESARSAAEPTGNFLVVLTPLTTQVPVRALWPWIAARAPQLS